MSEYGKVFVFYYEVAFLFFFFCLYHIPALFDFRDDVVERVYKIHGKRNVERDPTTREYF